VKQVVFWYQLFIAVTWSHGPMASYMMTS